MIPKMALLATITLVKDITRRASWHYRHPSFTSSP
jgi:hypothetical protein